MGKCIVCGASHASCGPQTTVTPVDERMTERGSPVALKKYRVTVENRRSTHETIMLLPEDEAARIGAVEYVKGEAQEKPAKAAAPRANKARTPRANKAKAPAASKQAPPATGGVEDATDPGASE